MTNSSYYRIHWIFSSLKTVSGQIQTTAYELNEIFSQRSFYMSLHTTETFCIQL